jgi:uncharacterized protein YukE
MDLYTGDSPELRSHGAMLRAAAHDVSGIADRLGRRVDVLAFHGPAADRFRAQMHERNLRLRRVAQELQDLADLVLQAGSARPS